VTIRLVPARRYATPWAGRYQYASRTVHLNADTHPEAIPGVLAHELAHARWSAPLPQLAGQDGAAQLFLETLDELRMHYWAVRSHPPVRDQLRTYLRHNFPAVIEPRNARGYALAYLFLQGQVTAGVLTPDEVAEPVDRIGHTLGLRTAVTLDQHIIRAFTIGPAQYGQLARLAKDVDTTATHRTTPHTTAVNRTTPEHP
jgi:hypothetical protein